MSPLCNGCVALGVARSLQREALVHHAGRLTEAVLLKESGR